MIADYDFEIVLLPLLFSQNTPSKPDGQLHSNLLASPLQTAPF